MRAAERDGRPALVVFAKVPEAGAVKTRLTTLLTPEEAARLYGAFLRDALAAYATLGVAVRLYLAPEGLASGGLTPEGAPEADGLVHELAHEGVSVHRQRGRGLGERMLGAFAETFLAGHERVAVVGTDHPTLPLAFVRLAFEELGVPFTVALGPSADGGYYLLGMNEVYPPLFQGITYSRPDVFARTLGRAHEVAGRVVVLPEWYDVDTPAALRRLAAELADGSAADAVRTREVVAALCGKYPLMP